jgi:hypothetical protein
MQAQAAFFQTQEQMYQQMGGAQEEEVKQVDEVPVQETKQENSPAHIAEPVEDKQPESMQVVEEPPVQVAAPVVEEKMPEQEPVAVAKEQSPVAQKEASPVAAKELTPEKQPESPKASPPKVEEKEATPPKVEEKQATPEKVVEK